MHISHHRPRHQPVKQHSQAPAFEYQWHQRQPGEEKRHQGETWIPGNGGIVFDGHAYGRWSRFPG